MITVTGPLERSVLVESTHARREDNMWGFTKVQSHVRGCRIGLGNMWGFTRSSPILGFIDLGVGNLWGFKIVQSHFRGYSLGCRYHRLGL